MKRLLAVLLAALVTAFAVVWFLDAGPFLAALRSNMLLARGPLTMPPVEKDEAIVVVTGDLRRIPRAFQLLQQRQSPLLVISGTQPGTTKTQLLGLPASFGENTPPLDRVILETESSSTRENALRTRELLEPRGVKSVILVTSDYHMYRTLGAFRAAAGKFHYIAYPVPSEAGDRYLQGGGWPHTSSKIASEFLKLMLYRHLYAFFEVTP